MNSLDEFALSVSVRQVLELASAQSRDRGAKRALDTGFLLIAMHELGSSSTLKPEYWGPAAPGGYGLERIAPSVEHPAYGLVERHKDRVERLELLWMRLAQKFGAGSTEFLSLG
jgi:hypothetical protein